MRISSPNVAVQQIVNRIDRSQISFKHKLQRREGVWNRNQKSLLIDSLLRGYAVNPTYTVLEDNTLYVIDGVQRLSTLYSFAKDEFPLSKNLEMVQLDNETFEIAGNKYSQLDEKIQDFLMSCQIQMCEISDYTEKDVREMFRRLNSGKPLNAIQRATPDMSDEFSNAINDIISHPFFEKVLTVTQIKNSVDLSIAMEILMLSAMSNEYDFGSFSKPDRNKFIQYYNDKVDHSKIAIIKQALDKLDEAFDDDVKIPKTSISMICYGCYRVIKDKKNTSKFIDTVEKFLENYEDNTEYKTFTVQGTSSGESVKGRLNYWRNIIRTM